MSAYALERAERRVCTDQQQESERNENWRDQPDRHNTSLRLTILNAVARPTSFAAVSQSRRVPEVIPTSMCVGTYQSSGGFAPITSAREKGLLAPTHMWGSISRLHQSKKRICAGGSDP
jgi:hypothetical protein